MSSISEFRMAIRSMLVALLLNCPSIPVHIVDTSWVSPNLFSSKLHVYLVNIIGHLSHARMIFLKQVTSLLLVLAGQIDYLRGLFSSSRYRIEMQRMHGP